MEKPKFELSKVKPKDKLQELFEELNASRKEVNLPPLTYPRLQGYLKKFEKAKNGWSKDIWIANILDAKNPSSYFWWLVNNKK